VTGRRAGVRMRGPQDVHKAGWPGLGTDLEKEWRMEKERVCTGCLDVTPG
jgi:hypothetical protein